MKRFALVFVVATILFLILAQVLGAPLLTPDSNTYLTSSTRPWASWGAWHPSGLSWALWFIHLFSHKINFALALLAGLRVALVWTLLQDAPKPIKFLGLALVGLAPAWIQMGASLWSEVLFSCILLGLALSFKRLPQRGLLFIAPLLFILLVETRHVGIFFLPAIAIAMGVGLCPLSANKLVFARRALIRLSVAGAALLVLWCTYNFLRSGNPLSPTRDAHACHQTLVALNSLPYCEHEPELELCAMDPQRQFINNESLDNFVGYSRLQFSEESPIVRFKNLRGAEALCAQEKLVMKVVKRELKGATLALFTRRFFDFFGSWQHTERGQGKHTDALAALDRAVELSNDAQPYVSVVALLTLVTLALVYPSGLLNPVFLFFIFGAIGHAAGLTINNPFLALRYISIHKQCLLMAAFVFLADYSRFLAKKGKIK